MNRISTLAAVLGGALTLALGGFALTSRRNDAVSAQTPEGTPPPVVQVTAAERHPMQRTVRLSGALKSGSRATLSPKLGGRVTGVYVRVGETVRRGQMLVRLDLSDMQRQAEEATAGVAAARANWEKAVEGERLKRVDVERRVEDARRGVAQAKVQLEKAEAGIRLQGKTSATAVQQAQAGVDAARSGLERARRGARPEQRRQAQIQVRQAERGAALAKKNLDDLEFLYSKGGVPRVQVDEAREGHQKALDGVAQAQAQLELLEAGATPEDIATAEAQVRSAEAGLAAAKAAGSREELNDADVSAARGVVAQAEAGLRAAIGARAELKLAQADVRAARSAYERAQVGARLAAQQLTGGTVESPVDGVATAVNTNVGEMAGPGQPLVTIVGTAGVYLEAGAPSRLVPEIRPGQPVAVSVDTQRGQTYTGVVRAVGQVAGPDGRSFPVQIDLSAPGGVLKPGGFATAQIVVERHEEAVTVPVDALRAEGERVSVWVVRGGKVVEVPVKTPIQDERRAMLEGDVRAGEPVVVSSAAGVRPGEAVETRAAAGP